MAIDIWFRDDIRNLLLSLNASSATTARVANSPHMAVYRLGYQEALAAVALACGLPPHAIGAGGRSAGPPDGATGFPEEMRALAG